jgi:16S rRNA (cytosine967-C5)-methyltransferase
MGELSQPQAQAGLVARRAALRILDRVSRGLPLDAALDLALHDLSDRDRRLAHELAAGVLRQQATIDARLTRHVPRGLGSVPPLIRGVLRLGSYQLDQLDRVPPHAAVSTSVDLAREVAGTKAAGFVNAVLRRAAADESPEAEPTDATAASLAQRYSHPEWLTARWLVRFGPAETEALLRWNNRKPPLVVQPARETLAQVRNRLDSAAISVEPAPYDAGLIVNARSPRQLPGYDDGAFVIQDPAQALVARFAAFDPAATLYDACAAPGGKTIALARDRHRVVAGEARRSRIPRLVENLKRAGSGSELVLAADAGAPPVRPMSCLLDAPCLGTGTFARHPDARWRVRHEALDRLARRQRDLLRAVATVVAPGALLVYATCSLESEENEVQVDRFLADSPDFRREPAPDFPAELLSPQGDLCLLPQRHGVDGAFAARLRRAA